MKKYFFLVIFILVSTIIRADGGLWIPALLQYQEEDMQKAGFKLTAGDVYSVNNGTLKDAVVLFGGGCTGGIISGQGLILTNHHCGYYHIQQRSSLENNYLEEGFWAKTMEEELPNPGLTVSVLVYMKDVTNDILGSIQEGVDENDRNEVIQQNITQIIKNVTEDTWYKADVKPLYYGNQYFLYVYEEYKDIRLVGAPPQSIGKFGGDTDNWMWPRHTGDFSLFRIYTSSDGKPADYSPENIPYIPKKHFKISLKGYQDGDFTAVMGYPGTTRQFLTSEHVNLIVNVKNPLAVDLRSIRLNVIKNQMNQNTQIRLLYAAKEASIANSWKKWQGETQGVNAYGLIEQKRQEEAILQQEFNNKEGYENYVGIAYRINELVHQLKPFERATVFYNEGILGVEILKYFTAYNELYFFSKTLNKEVRLIQDKIYDIQRITENFWKEYSPQIDEQVLASVLNYYFQHQTQDMIPDYMNELYRKYKGDVNSLAHDAFSKSIFTDREKVMNFITSYKSSQIKILDNDILYQIYKQSTDFYYDKFYPQYLELNRNIQILYRYYVQGLIKVYPERSYYPDANLTMRLAYGHISAMYPQDGLAYLPYTTLEGVIAKNNPQIYDYQVPEKLKNLYLQKDYDKYTNEKGELPVAFIASNHTTGGNSGSPVLNAKGELIGLNFDRLWEGTMSDLKFDTQRCRNISVDIRYCLFIIDKYAEAQNIIEELSIVK